WRPDPDAGYTVDGGYQILTHQSYVALHDAENLIWHPQVPLKVSIFAWRLLRDRLPTGANLVTRGVLSSTVDSCVFGCGVAESAHHLFLSCSIAGSLWDLGRAWVGISPMDFTPLRDHFVQFTASAGVSRAR
ncbi:70 kDa peptidyl-prolyl isomerase, partial [Trifolium pratense]